jgi:hypothetical protein
MERRMRGNSHVRCGVGENPEITSKDYLSLLIVVLLVVVTGAVFLALYQGSITDIWNGIVGRMKTVFGI